LGKWIKTKLKSIAKGKGSGLKLKLKVKEVVTHTTLTKSVVSKNLQKAFIALEHTQQRGNGKKERKKSVDRLHFVGYWKTSLILSKT
jgi:hypothetical protein